MSPFEEVLEVAQWGWSFEYSQAGYSTKYSIKNNMSMQP